MGCCHVAGAALTARISVAFSLKQTGHVPGPPGLESLVRISIVPAPEADALLGAASACPLGTGSLHCDRLCSEHGGYRAAHPDRCCSRSLCVS